MKPLLELTDPPELSDQAAAQMLDFLHELATAFENHYATQIARFYQDHGPHHPDLFDDNDDGPTPF